MLAWLMQIGIFHVHRASTAGHLAFLGAAQRQAIIRGQVPHPRNLIPAGDLNGYTEERTFRKTRPLSLHYETPALVYILDFKSSSAFN